MAEYDVYKEIAERTDGSIYIGVVGPVRTGKSTLIRRFMDLMVVPELSESWYRERLIDELPQSGGGKTIMTTQISFVPAEPIDIDLSNKCRCKLRMVDCVGYMVEGALGDHENGLPRLVRTPWSKEEVPFSVAAENGTRKVIQDHATIALLVTTDGTITDIPRSAYAEAERRTVRELKELGKPFAMVLNSKSPFSDTAQELKERLSLEYDVPVMALDVLNMDKDDIYLLMDSVLNEFPVRQVEIDVDEWVRGLPGQHPLITELMELTRKAGESLKRIRDCEEFAGAMGRNEHIQAVGYDAIEPGVGTLRAHIELPKALYYELLSDQCGLQIRDDAELMAVMSDLAVSKREFERLADAWQEVKQSGYGLIKPTAEEMVLDEPETVKQGSSYGVRLKAKAPSYHLIRIDLDTELSPFVGTERQSEELVKYLLDGFSADKQELWKTQLFGRPMHELVKENLAQKLVKMPAEVQRRARAGLSRVVNDGKENFYCIVF